MKYIKGYKKINEELLAMSTIGNMLKKTLGTYQSPIWIHIKIFDNNGEKNCFLENDWVEINNVNKYLYDIINRKLKLNLFKKINNVIKYEDVDKICNFLGKIGLNIYKSEENEGNQIITIHGKISEHDLKYRINESKIENELYYTTSKPISLSEFIEIEVEDRENYDIDDVNEWIEKYNIKSDAKLLWVAKKPWIAARYQMLVEDWDKAEDIYNNSPEDYDILSISGKKGEIIIESDDGDDGFIMILKDTK